jgi:hypothetical protein
VLCFVYGLYDGLQQSFLGGVFTTWICVAMLGFSGTVLYHLLAGHTDNPVNYDLEAGNAAARDGGSGPWRYVAWLGGLLAASALVGFFLALVAFFILFLRTEAQASWLRTLVLTGAAAAFLLVLADALVLDFPQGLLQDSVDLPWPLR